MEAAGDAGGPDALQAHAAGADIHQDLAQDPAAGESLDYQKCSEIEYENHMLTIQSESLLIGNRHAKAKKLSRILVKCDQAALSKTHVQKT